MIDEHWDPTIADGLDLGEDFGPDYGAGDTVCFKDWPDFTYQVDEVAGDTTEVCDTDDPFYTTSLPTAALRKVQQEPVAPREDPEDREVDADSELTLAELKALEELAGVNQRVRHN